MNSSVNDVKKSGNFKVLLERDADYTQIYTQIVFHPQDPDDRMTPSMIVVQINDSCMVQAAYETYPSYIPETVQKP